MYVYLYINPVPSLWPGSVIGDQQQYLVGMQVTQPEAPAIVPVESARRPPGPGPDPPPFPSDSENMGGPKHSATRAVDSSADPPRAAPPRPTHRAPPTPLPRTCPPQLPVKRPAPPRPRAQDKMWCIGALPPAKFAALLSRAGALAAAGRHAAAGGLRAQHGSEAAYAAATGGSLAAAAAADQVGALAQGLRPRGLPPWPARSGSGVGSAPAGPPTPAPDRRRPHKPTPPYRALAAGCGVPGDTATPGMDASDAGPGEGVPGVGARV
jgi:hypothetical protein